MLGVSLAVAKAAAFEQGLPLYRYLGGERRARAAGADDERAERRRARRQPGGLPGVHGRAGRGAELRGGAAMGAETFHALKKLLQGRGLSTAGGDEGGFAPGPGVERGGARDAVAGIEAAGYRARGGRRDRARPRHQRAVRGRRVPARARGPHALQRGAGGYWADLAGRYRSSRSRTAWTRRTGRGGSS